MPIELAVPLPTVGAGELLTAMALGGFSKFQLVIVVGVALACEATKVAKTATKKPLNRNCCLIMLDSR